MSREHLCKEDPYKFNMEMFMLKVDDPSRAHAKGCGFFAYSWKLPTYSWAFLLTVDNSSFSTYSWSFFTYNFSFFAHSWSFFAYNGKVRLIRALRDCEQRSWTVSKKAPTVSKKASPHAKGVVLCQRTCFCLLSTFQAPPIKRSLLRTLPRTLSLLKTLTGAF